MQRVREPLAKAGKTGVIPPKRNRTEQRDYDRDLYKTRHLIEKLFEKRKSYRGHRHPPRQIDIAYPLRHPPCRGTHLAQLMTPPGGKRGKARRPRLSGQPKRNKPIRIRAMLILRQTDHCAHQCARRRGHDTGSRAPSTLAAHGELPYDSEPHGKSIIALNPCAAPTTRGDSNEQGRRKTGCLERG